MKTPEVQSCLSKVWRKVTSSVDWEKGGVKGVETKDRTNFTYKDRKSLPESKTRQYGLLEGELIMVPSLNFEHQRISGNLEFL